MGSQAAVTRPDGQEGGDIGSLCPAGVGEGGDVLRHIITMDESAVSMQTPETKLQCIQ